MSHIPSEFPSVNGVQSPNAQPFPRPTNDNGPGPVSGSVRGPEIASDKSADQIFTAITTCLARNGEHVRQAIACNFTYDLFQQNLNERQFNLFLSVLFWFFTSHNKIPMATEMRLECTRRIAMSPLEFAGAEAAVDTLVAAAYGNAPVSWEYALWLMADILYERSTKPLMDQLSELTPTLKQIQELQAALNTVSTLRSGTIASDCRSAADWLKDQEVLAPPKRLASSYTAIDKALNGGFMLSGSYIIAALTANGKSSLALNIARRVAAGATGVLLFTPEATPQQAHRQLLAQVSKLTVSQLEALERHPLCAEDSQKLAIAKTHVSTLPLYTEGMLSEIGAIERQVRHHSERGTKLFIFDQSSWMHARSDDPKARQQSAQEEASEISRRLKVLARELGIVTIVLVQVNRTGAAARGQGQRLELSHLKNSGRFEEDADGVLLIQGIDRTTTPYTLNVEVAKHRHGSAQQTLKLRFYAAQNLIDDDPSALEPKALSDTTSSDVKSDKTDWRPADLARNGCVSACPQSKAQIIHDIMYHKMFEGGKSISRNKAEKLFSDALDMHLIHKWVGGKFVVYSTEPQKTPPPEQPSEPMPPDSKRSRVEALLADHPDWSSSKIAAELAGDVDDSYVRKIRRERDTLSESGTNGTGVPPSESRS